jgi:predicted O-methyltransferase YrrM|tara:strand:- start:47 stop:451 length:405 start_codon:yes stop_codon:yes gene_type:complete
MDRYQVLEKFAKQHNWQIGVVLPNNQWHTFLSLYFSAEKWGNRITIIKERTLDIVDQFDNASLDFVFHDSGHSYPFVMNEIKAYACKLRPGGFHIGDDLNWDPVRQSVEEAFDNTHTKIGKNCWYKQKSLYDGG